MSESYAVIRLLGVMDCLWFNQIILFQKPSSIIASKTLKISSLPVFDSFTNYESPSMFSVSDEILSVTSACLTTSPQDESDKEAETRELKERPKRSKVTSQKTRSQSLSPSNPKHSRNLKYSSSLTRLQKTMSCNNLSELEEEEDVKGFIKANYDDDDDDDDDVDADEHDDDHMLRPYLSEGWLIRRHDSSLLNLRLPRVSSVAEMKKHLRFWARTVASEIQQES